MKNLHELSRCMQTLAGYYDRANGSGAFKILDEEALETLCDAIGAHMKGEQCLSAWGLACGSFFNS